MKLENRKKKKTEKILFNLERPDEMKETVGNWKWCRTKKKEKIKWTEENVAILNTSENEDVITCRKKSMLKRKELHFVN